MVLRLRLARVPGPGGAKKHRPIYNIVLAQARSARDSKPMEVLGTYDPIPKVLPGANTEDRKTKEIKVDVTRTKYWLGVGAQPSDTVWRLLAMVRADELTDFRHETYPLTVRYCRLASWNPDTFPLANRRKTPSKPCDSQHIMECKRSRGEWKAAEEKEHRGYARLEPAPRVLRIRMKRDDIHSGPGIFTNSSARLLRLPHLQTSSPWPLPIMSATVVETVLFTSTAPVMESIA